MQSSAVRKPTARERARTQGRVTPRKGATPPGPAKSGGARQSFKEAISGEKWDVRESRSVRSAWIWRGFVMLALVALGIAILLGTSHRHTSYAIAWLVIAAGWFGIAMWLWRMHSRYMKEP